MINVLYFLTIYNVICKSGEGNYIMTRQNKLNAFSLTEISIVVLIIAIISILWLKIANSRAKFNTKIQDYAAVKNFNDAVAYVKKIGYKDDSGTIAYTFPTDKTKFCNFLANIYNVSGATECTQADVPEN